jgi:nucleotide-binding universal stress UspA family protein
MANPTSIVVSYDGTNNEDDAVALGRMFAQAGADVSLAYVRHYPETEAGREALAESEAEELLRRGAALLGGHELGRHVVTDRSTPEGLRKLAEQVGASAVVFCSDSHTAKGHIAIGNSARRLIEGGPLAVAIAPAGFAAQERAGLRSVFVDAREEGSAHATAEALAAATGATLTGAIGQADLIVVGSRAEAEAGRIGLSASSEKVIEDLARGPILVLPRGVELSFVSGGSRPAPHGDGGVPVAA